MAQLQKGTTYITGDQVTAANLNALVDSGTLIAGAITDQTAKTVPLAADTILLHSAADTALRKTTMTQLFATPQPLGATTPSSVAATTGTFSSTLGATGLITASANGQGIACASADANGSYLGFRKSGTTFIGAIGAATQSAGVGTVNDVAIDVGGANHVYITTAETIRGDFTAAGLAITGTLSATGTISHALSANSGVTGFSSQNSNAGSSAYLLGSLNNGTNTFNSYLLGLNWSGTFLTGGPTSQSAGFYTSANIPISIGINNAEVAQFTSTGLNSTAIGATTPSTGAFTTVSATTLAVSSTSSFDNTVTILGSDSLNFRDTGVQLYSSATNIFKLYVGGADRLSVDTTGLAVTGTLSCTGNATITGGTVTLGGGKLVNDSATITANGTKTISGINSGILIIRQNTQGGTALINIDPVGGVAIISDPNSQFSTTDGGAASNKFVVTVSGLTVTILNRWTTSQVTYYNYLMAI